MLLKNLLIFSYLFFTFINLTVRREPENIPIESPSKILKDTWSWLYYKRDFLRLAEDFKAYNQNSGIMNKGAFLKALMTGEYLPLRLTKDEDNKHSYKLYKLNSLVNSEIKTIIKNFSEDCYKNYSYEGKKLPHFNFEDIKNRKFNSKTSLGKILVLKCWFVNCHACVEEIPSLNNLVKRYENRKDILFIGLALDSRLKLQTFLNKTPLNYMAIPNQATYMENSLGVRAYPTHILVDEKGIIRKVVNDADELIFALNKLIN